MGNHKNRFKVFSGLVVFLLLSGLVTADTVPLENLLSRKAIKTRVHLLGHSGAFNVNVDFTNQTDDTLDFQLESGRMFNTISPELQDLVVVESEQLRVFPRSSVRSTFNAYCKDKHKRGPSSGVAIELGQMSKGKILKVCQYLNDKEYTLNTVQNAVWVASDSIPISGVFSRADEGPKIAALRKFLTELQRGSYVPYMIEYRSEGPHPWQQIPVYMVFDDAYTVKKAGYVRIVFTDAAGTVVRELMAPTKRAADKFDLHVRMYLEGLQQGTYHVKVFRDQFLQKEWSVEL